MTRSRRRSSEPRVVFRRIEASDDKLAQLNVLRTDQDRREFDEVADRYLADLRQNPRTREQITAEAVELTARVEALKARLGVKKELEQ